MQRLEIDIKPFVEVNVICVDNLRYRFQVSEIFKVYETEKCLIIDFRDKSQIRIMIKHIVCIEWCTKEAIK